MRKKLPKPVPSRTREILSPEYLSFKDYLYPIFVSILFDCTLFFSLALIYVLFHPEAFAILTLLALQVVCLLAAVDAVGMGFAAAYYHHLWRKQLSTHGPSAYETRIELPIPAHQAFELALAATTQVKNGRLSTIDDKNGHIQVVAKSPWWYPVDSCVDVSVGERSGKAIVSIATYSALSPQRHRSMMLFWGKKWMPILCSLDVRRNQKVTRELVNFIEFTPDWDYHHIASIKSDAEADQGDKPELRSA